MKDNPFNLGKGAAVPKLSKQELVDRGNANLLEIGRHDVEWRLSAKDEVYITWKHEPERWVGLSGR